MIHTQILDQAADWFVTLRESGADAVTREEFSAWLCRSPEHVQAYLEITSIWAEAAGPDVQRELDAQTLIERARAEDNVVALEENGLVHRIDRESLDKTNAPQSLPEEIHHSCPGIASAFPRGASEDNASRQSRRKRAGAWGHRDRLLAASVAAVCVGSVLWWQVTNSTTYVTGIGEERSITLEDGSRIELNARSRIRVRFSENERRVYLLEGQGLFQVARNPQRPFIVHSDDARVRAVGTQFDVYRKSSGTVVTVIEGKVEVRTAAPRSSATAESSVDAIDTHAVSPSSLERQARRESAPQSGQAPRIAAVQLVAGEQAIVADDQITRPQVANVAAATAWRQRQLVFDSVTLAEAAREFNRYNQRQLVIRDAQLERFLISGVFSSSDPSSLLRFLQEQPDFVVQETDKEIRIDRRR